MQWVIEPATVRAICAAVDQRASDFDAAATRVASAFEEAAGAAGSQTARALAEVSTDPFIDELAAMRQYLATVTETTRSVVGCYEAADLDMAAETQRSMRTVLP